MAAGPRMLGGNIDLAKDHFASALRINGGKFLMTYVYQARSVAVQTLDEALFDECLQKVEAASLEILPGIPSRQCHRQEEGTAADVPPVLNSSD